MILPISNRITQIPPYSNASAVIIMAFSYGTFTLCNRLFQNRSPNHNELTAGRCSFQMLILQPPISNTCRLTLTRFGLFPFRSPLLRESLTYFLFLGVLKYFTSLGSLHHPMDSGEDTPSSTEWVSHSEIPGSKSVERLPGAYRSWPRPSSPSCA